MMVKKFNMCMETEMCMETDRLKRGPQQHLNLFMWQLRSTEVTEQPI